MAINDIVMIWLFNVVLVKLSNGDCFVPSQHHFTQPSNVSNNNHICSEASSNYKLSQKLPHYFRGHRDG